MKTTIWGALLALLFMGSCSDSSVVEPEVSPAEEEEQDAPFEPSRYTYIETPLTRDAVDHMSGFEINLLKDICDNNPDNVVYSPISVITTMTMLLNGGDEEARQEFIDLLNGGYSGIFPGGKLTMEKLNEYCRILINQLPVVDNQCSFFSKNSIWHDPSITLQPAFAEVMTQTFDAGEIKINPSGIESMELINKWVSDATQGNMASFLTKPLEDIHLAAINALCFKGTWSDKFDKDLTQEREFHNQSGVKTQTAFMETEQKVDGVVGRYLTAAEVTYGNGNFKFIIVMPSENSDFDAMFEDLRDIKLSGLSGVIGTHMFKVSMPKFKSTFNNNLVESLQNVGVKKAFENSFTNMVATQSPLYLRCFIHGANFEVDEDGAQGSAATLGGIWIGASGYEPEVKETMVFDRPFIYLVKETSTNAILFMGCVRNL